MQNLFDQQDANRLEATSQPARTVIEDGHSWVRSSVHRCLPLRRDAAADQPREYVRGAAVFQAAFTPVSLDANHEYMGKTLIIKKNLTILNPELSNVK